MINHTTCDHPSTSGARAKCRRGGADSGPKRKVMGATPKEPTASSDREQGDNYGQTPARKDMECHTCGVERIRYKGTDPVTGILLFVGDKCYWKIKNAEDRAPVDKL